ncbi:MAG TPA: carbamoyl phosphate synthase small subunit, partial [Ruminococcus sp.]|nr:carbamoyl phosphate synthase small subunit [Ruminococcus sp.]
MSLFNIGEKAYLMLENGQVFEGRSFGAKGTVIGEVVFTTGVTGYQETLTDPSYYGQIVTQTFPLIGNYGINSEDSESEKSYVSGYIVREWCNAPSNFRCEGNVDDFLKNNNIIGIHNIDTRQLTRIIREKGVMNGVITTENVYDKKDELLEKIKAFSVKNAV